MTRLLISTAFAGLLAFGGAAWAQGDEHRDRGPRGQGAPAAQAAPAAPAQNREPRIGGRFGRGYNPPVQNAPAAQPAPAPAQNARQESGENRRGRAMDRTPGTNNNFGRGPDNNGPGNNDRRAFGNDRRDFGNDRRALGNDRRGPDIRRDFSAYRRAFNAPRRYRVSYYQRPRGWYAHRWTFGEVLPSLFWTPNFWLNDYYDYGLEPPPPGTVWVRDGEDALLIDRFSGEIIEVAYNIFY